MSHTNVEIKARCNSADRVRDALRSRGAVFKGTDRQVDTYFKVKRGRLKLREGPIENNLIFYSRNDQAEPKISEVILYHPSRDPSLKEALVASLGVLVTVEKTREIYFIGNVKFHIDVVDGLGNFVEIEAIDKDGTKGKKALLEQCQEYMRLLDIGSEDLVSNSYSDMFLLQKNRNPL